VFCQVDFPGFIIAFSLVWSSVFPWCNHREFPGFIIRTPWSIPSPQAVTSAA
jgi:hypothetical protein